MKKDWVNKPGKKPVNMGQRYTVRTILLGG
jgi:hypothetical protein